jgi:RNA polymerase sigma-70 factor (ECF subfamily)
MHDAAEIKVLQQRLAEEDSTEAFGQLYMAYMQHLLQFAKSIIRNHELAEEIVSDVFIRIWQNRKKVADIDNLKLYLYVSTKNTALNYLSRHFRKQSLSLDEMTVNLSTASYNPEELLITSEAVKRIEHEIRQLPPRCKLIFKLVKEDGLKYNDIAQLLNISVKTIDSQMAIAVKKISSAIHFELKRNPRPSANH